MFVSAYIADSSTNSNVLDHFCPSCESIEEQTKQAMQDQLGVKGLSFRYLPG